eukprot:Amastigsp_a677360_8.p2 type:complete len:139 gc:universal Amastigsp_a677360_8:536-952(+)
MALHAPHARLRLPRPVPRRRSGVRAPARTLLDGRVGAKAACGHPRASRRQLARARGRRRLLRSCGAVPHGGDSQAPRLRRHRERRPALFRSCACKRQRRGIRHRGRSCASACVVRRLGAAHVQSGRGLVRPARSDRIL